MSALFSLQEPLLLGLGLAGFGVAWLFVAALLSMVLPARRGPRERRRRRGIPFTEILPPPEAPPLPAPSLPLLRKQIENHYQGLLERVMALEHVPPAALSPYDAYALLNEKAARLKEELERLREGVEGRHAREQTQAQLAQRVEGLSRSVSSLMERSSVSAAPPPAPAPTPAEKKEVPLPTILPLLEEARAARGVYVEQSVASARRAAEEAAGTFQAGNESFQERLESQGWALSQEQDSRRRVLERLEKRLARWRALWQERLDRQRGFAASLGEDLLRRNDSLRSLLEQGRSETEQGLRAIEEQWVFLRKEREDFKRHVTGFWPAEEAQGRQRLETLEAQRAELEFSLKGLAERRAQEKARFEEGLSLLRRTVREERCRWEEQVHAVEAENERRQEAAEAELSRARAMYTAEKQSMNETILSRRNALNEGTERLKAEKTAWEEAAGRERAEIEEKLQNLAGALAEREKAQAEVQALLAAEQEGYDRRRKALYAWAGSRFETLERLLQEIHRAASERREALARERQALLVLLERERTGFHETLALLENQYQKKATDLEGERKDAAAAHADALQKARAEEARLETAALSLGETIARLEQEAEALRRQNAHRLARRRERYERMLVRLEQKSSRDRADSEVRLAEQRMELETVRHRLALRKSRVEAWLRRRREALENLFNEAHQALEVVRQGHAREVETGRRRMGSLEAQRALLESRRQALARLPEALAEELRRRERQDTEAFESEKTRLAREAEECWNDFLERSASNHETLKKAMRDFQAAEADLLRQEKAAREFLEAARAQAQQFQSLKERRLVRRDEPSPAPPKG